MTNNFSLINSYLRISGCRALQVFSKFAQKFTKSIVAQKLIKSIIDNGNLGLQFFTRLYEELYLRLFYKPHSLL